MTTPLAIIESLQYLAVQQLDVDILWLYGSRAKHTESESSDYDLAVAFSSNDSVDSVFSYPCDKLVDMWSQQTGEVISVIDINRVAVPLAFAVIDEGRVLHCKNAFRLHSEELRIWSLWEAYRFEYTKYRK